MPATTSSPAATSEEVNVTLCHFGPSRLVPSPSSFVLKMETYLRMVEIPFKCEFSLKKSSKGKIPFIKCDGKEISDTNFIIPFLNKKYEKDLNSSLSVQDKAVSLAFKRLIEENLYWTLVHYRWIENFPGFSKQLSVTGLRKKMLPIAAALTIKPSVRSNLHGHGIGRHTVEEIHEIMKQDLKALSEYLGSKPYFMGDEPTEVDASLFGLLAQFTFGSPATPHEKLIKEEMANLFEYAEKMKEKYFPDWTQKLAPPEKKKEEAAPEVKGEEQEAKEDEKVESEANGSEKKNDEVAVAENTEKVEEAAAQEPEKPSEENGKAEDATKDESGSPDK